MAAKDNNNGITAECGCPRKIRTSSASWSAAPPTGPISSPAPVTHRARPLTHRPADLAPPQRLVRNFRTPSRGACGRSLRSRPRHRAGKWVLDLCWYMHAHRTLRKWSRSVDRWTVC